MESRRLALKWTIYDPSVLTFRFHALGQAQDWQQFRTALATFGGSPQNVVYGDVDGNIGYQTAGFMPIRAKHGDEAVCFPNAGHAVGGTGLPTAGSMWATIGEDVYALGGTAEANARAGRAADEKVRAFLGRAAK